MLSGVLLLRFAERQLLALLLHEPPRNTPGSVFRSAPCGVHDAAILSVAFGVGEPASQQASDLRKHPRDMRVFAPWQVTQTHRQP